jgi:hypothetical protein
VEVAGAGTRLPTRRLRPDRLRAKVHEATRLREGARRIQQGFAAAGGPSGAADAFETHLLPQGAPAEATVLTGPSIFSRLLGCGLRPPSHIRLSSQHRIIDRGRPCLLAGPAHP